MKKYSVLIALFIVVGAAVNSLQAGRNTAFNTVATYTRAGALPVDGATVLNSWEELSGYLSATYYDTSELTPRPDFNSVTVFAVAYNKKGEDYTFTQSVRTVSEITGSMIVDVKVDSALIMPGITPHEGFHVILISFPKTGKPVSVRINSPTEVARTKQFISRKIERCGVKTGLVQTHTVNLCGQRISTLKGCGLKIMPTENGLHKILVVDQSR